MFINIYKMSYIPIAFALILTTVRVVYAFLREDAFWKISSLLFFFFIIFVSAFVLNYYKNSIKSLVTEGDSYLGVLLNNRQIKFKQEDIVSVKREKNATKIVLSNKKSYKVFDNTDMLKLNKIDEGVLDEIIRSR